VAGTPIIRTGDIVAVFRFEDKAHLPVARRRVSL